MARGIAVQAWAQEAAAPAEAAPEHVPTTLYVSPTGDDAQSGLGPKDALKTIQAAVAQVRGGDEIVLLPGTWYVDSIAIAAIPDIGPERRVTIRAEPRGAATISRAWPAAARGEVTWREESDGIYSAPRPAHVDGTPMPSSMGGFGRDLLLGWSTLDELRANTCLFNVHRTGKPEGSTFKTPGYGFAFDEDRIHLRLPDRSDPNGRRIVITNSQRPGGNRHPREAGLLLIEDCPGLTIDGVRFEGAYVALAFNETSPHALVRNCVFEWCHIGVNLPSQSIAEWNEFSYTGLKRLMDACRDLNGRFDSGMIFSFGYHQVWMFGAFLGHVGRGPREVEIRHNYVHEAWDGLWFGGFRSSHCRHNIFQDCIDNVVEFEQSYAPDLHFHHNLILGAANGVISQARPDRNMQGPHYIYRNVIVGYDDPGWDSWTLLKLRADGRSRGYVYHHNLIWVRTSSLYWRTTGKKAWLAALKSVDFRNNVVIAEKLSLPDGAPFAVGHNVLIGSAGPNLDLQGKEGFHLDAISAAGFVDPEQFDFTLRPGSPLIAAGQRTPERFAEAAMQPGDADVMPSIGPFEPHEQMGPDWPRPRRTVFNTGTDASPRLVDAPTHIWD